ncbi:molybdopterin-guanine dinucleotide biosynthesis protein B [Gracilibacillus sp. Marseille-QA3620]
MALVAPVWQVVGYQNSGKTTFILSMIAYLKEKGIETAVLKHHGHGGKPDSTAWKDSDKHFHAGAAAALVEGEGFIHLQGRMDEESLLHKNLALLMVFNPEIIILEGYKKAPYPKIVLIREEEDLSLLEELTNCQAVLLWPEVNKNHEWIPFDVAVFSLEENMQIFEWLMGKMKLNHERI